MLVPKASLREYKRYLHHACIQYNTRIFIIKWFVRKIYSIWYDEGKKFESNQMQKERGYDIICECRKTIYLNHKKNRLLDKTFTYKKEDVGKVINKSREKEEN